MSAENVHRQFLAGVAKTAIASSDGLGTGRITDEEAAIMFVTVTSGNANYFVTLPSPRPGRKVILHNGATAYKLRSNAPASVAINAGTGSSASSTIPANSTVELTCVSETAWKGFYMDADSDLAKVPAAS